MMELFKGIEGSPITFLTEDINAVQTTITVNDDAFLPDAPNICTIGFGENIETIKYTGKSGGVLTGVTRGIEGTPQSWPIGTEVARFFTAYDHNTMIDEFSSHLADYATNTPEISVNDDGVALKYPSGALICMRTMDFFESSFSTEIVQGLTMYRTPSAPMAWPSEFVDTDYFVVGTRIDTSGTIRSTPIDFNIYTKYTGSANVRALGALTLPSQVTFDVVAIGRWK